MSNSTVRRAVFRELKEHHDGISIDDLTIVTNATTKEVKQALSYFNNNSIVKEQDTHKGKRWFIQI